jgi:redox-sensitive bicupin YhaK (pirin superfamily)
VIIEARPIKLTTRTGIEVRRTLPHAKLKTIGAWCFVDHFGPTEQTEDMVVAAHPHTGLQTVTWLFEGLIEHRDSIGSVQLIEAGQLNLMTAGYGISHSELSLKTEGNLHAVQLWVALPELYLNLAPAFEHQADLPVVEQPGLRAKVLVGEFMGALAPTTHFSELLGVELRLQPGKHTISLNPEYEHGLMLAQGDLLAGEEIEVSSLKYLAQGETQVELETRQGAVVMLLGGVPFAEKILMWWNFIGRSHEEVELARAQWNAREDRFGSFEDQIGGWIPAPEMPSVRLQPR